jgi:tRNA/rRNA methyltransferase
MTAPVIILIEPQLGENIGACARAMLNCGVTELRLVNPRDGWPSEKALASSAGADRVINDAQLFSTTQAAIADCDLVYATGARLRHLNLPIDTGEEAAPRLVAAARPAILFGPERTGLHNDDVALASRFLTIPLNPGFTSLNIAQAVLLVSYLWHRENGLPPVDHSRRTASTQPATQEQVEGSDDSSGNRIGAGAFLHQPNQETFHAAELARRLLAHGNDRAGRADLSRHRQNAGAGAAEREKIAFTPLPGPRTSGGFQQGRPFILQHLGQQKRQLKAL